MSTLFIKYTPDVETADPGFDENLQTVIAKTERYIAQSVTTEGTGHPVRDAHAKGYGLVRGEVEILDQCPADYAQGIYATPRRHDALIRFSNGSPHAGADARLGGATGLALKIFGIPGPSLLDDEPDTHTFDYANINAPVFFCNTVEHYLFIQDLFIDAPRYFAQGTSGRHRFYQDFVTRKGSLDQDHWAWDEFLAFLRVLQSPPVNLLLSTYWTMGAVRQPSREPELDHGIATASGAARRDLGATGGAARHDPLGASNEPPSPDAVELAAEVGRSP